MYIMRHIYNMSVFEPDDFDNNWMVAYYCANHNSGKYPSESYWIVPGTLNLEE